MKGIVVWARRVDEPLKVASWPLNKCNCSCGGKEARKMIRFDGTIDIPTDLIKDTIAPDGDGRIVWVVGAKRFVKEVVLDDGSLEYYTSWRGHGIYQPESYERYVYYLVDTDNPDLWQMYKADSGQLELVADADEIITEEDIENICR